MKLGDLLLLKGVINKKQLTDALRKQSQEAINYSRSVPLGKVLIELGHVSVDEVADVLNEQSIERKKELKVVKEEKEVMTTQISESSKYTFDLKFIATMCAILISASATYFSITGQVEDNADEIANIKSMGDIKIISYKMEEYSETFKDLKTLANTLSTFAVDVNSIKADINNLKNKKIDIPEVDLSGILDKLDALSIKIDAFETRIEVLEKRNSGGSRF